VAALAVAVAFVAVSYLVPLIAAEDVDAAAGGWRSDPNGAFDRLDQAANLNFLSDEADVVAGAIAERLRRYGRMRASFEAALDRNPYNWYSRMELGALEAVEGNRAAALAQLRSARDLNPREELITEVLADVRQQRTVSLRALDRALLGRVCARFGQTEATRFCN
jgi:tetratricopeptide (TPR) repeat protein